MTVLESKRFKINITQKHLEIKTKAKVKVSRKTTKKYIKRPGKFKINFHFFRVVKFLNRFPHLSER